MGTLMEHHAAAVDLVKTSCDEAAKDPLPVKRFVEWIRHKQELERQLSAAKTKLAELERQVLDYMEQTSCSQFKCDGVTCSTRKSIKASAVKEGRDELIAALSGNEDTAWMVTPNYNAQTLNAWVRELPRSEDDEPVVPQHLEGRINVFTEIKVQTRSS